MKVDHGALAKIVDQAYVYQVSRVYGEDGILALRALILALREIYRHIDPSSCRNAITVIRRLSPGIGPGPHDRVLPRPLDIQEYAVTGFFLEIAHDNTLIIRGERPIQGLVQEAISYRYEHGSEYIHVGTNVHRIEGIFPGFNSIFAIPTFSAVEEALHDYRHRVVRYSHCETFQRCWHDPKTRLYLRNGDPEAEMRRSLYAYLQATLDDAEVRPEQIVDESHPVDIKVTFHSLQRIALIEIKWMGDSLADDGHVTAQHREARANAGAKQLAEYLDANKPYVPNYVSVGYLFVVDARRRGIRPNGPLPSTEDALFYADKDVIYAPAYHERRADFRPPVRAFAEPKLQP